MARFLPRAVGLARLGLSFVAAMLVGNGECRPVIAQAIQPFSRRRPASAEVVSQSWSRATDLNGDLPAPKAGDLPISPTRVKLVEAQGVEPYRQFPCKGNPQPATAPEICLAVRPGIEPGFILINSQVPTPCLLAHIKTDFIFLGGSAGTRTRTWHLKRVLRCRYATLPLQFQFSRTTQRLFALAVGTRLLELGRRDEGISRGQRLSFHFLLLAIEKIISTTHQLVPPVGIEPTSSCASSRR